MSNSKTCGNCANHDRDSVPRILFRKAFRPCRGSTPLIEVNGQYGHRGVFPLMPDDGWCAHHTPIPPAVGVRVGTPTVEG